MWLPTPCLLLLCWATVLTPAAEGDASKSSAEGRPEEVHRNRWIRRPVDVMLHGIGSHRTLEYKADVQALTAQIGCQVSQVLIVQPLPSELYVDPYELMSLERGSGGTSYHVDGRIELELPAPMCEPLNVRIVSTATDPGRESTSSKTHSVSLPVHARYPAPLPPDTPAAFQTTSTWLAQLSSGSTEAVIHWPLLLASCKKVENDQGQRSDVHSINECLLQGMESAADETCLQDKSAHWRIPAGSTQHASCVNALTVGAALASCAYLLAALVKHKP